MSERPQGSFRHRTEETIDRMIEGSWKPLDRWGPRTRVGRGVELVAVMVLITINVFVVQPITQPTTFIQSALIVLVLWVVLLLFAQLSRRVETRVRARASGE